MVGAKELVSKLNADISADSSASQEDIARCLEVMRELEALGSTAVAPLANVVHTDLVDKYYARKNAAVLLGRIGTDEALDILVDLQQQGTDFFSTVPFLTLGIAAVDALVRGLKHPKHIVALRSAWLLTRIGEEEALKRLIEAAPSSPYEIVRGFAQGATEVLNARRHSDS